MKAITLSFLIVSVCIAACRKPIIDVHPFDNTPPVITINGNSSYSQPAPNPAGTGVWVNPTATANDAQDGDVTSSIVVIGSVDPNITGQYYLFYTAHDAANNYNTDTVVVNIGSGPHVAPYLAGVYPNCHDTCSSSWPPYNYSSTWTCDNVINNRVFIGNFGAFGTAVTVTCTVDPVMQTLSFTPPCALYSNYYVTSASGSYTHNGNNVNVLINYAWNDGTTITNCISTYVK